MSPLDPRARAVRARYAEASARTRAYVAVRLLTCPFEAILDAIPAGSRLLDVGCGAGVLGHLAADSGSTVVGVDPDRRKVATAQRSAGRDSALDVLEGHIEDAPAGPFDVVALVDVLYLEPEASQASMLDAAIDRLAPGGLVLVKTMHRESAWRHRLARLQESVAVRVVGWTQGRALETPPPERVEAWLRDRGLVVTTRRVDRGYPHPHVLIEGRLETGGAS